VIGQIWKNLEDEQTYLIINHYEVQDTSEKDPDIVNNCEWHYKSFCLEKNRTIHFALDIPIEDDPDYWQRLA
jgi:hypothetical protein